MKNYKSILACVLALLLVFVNGNIAPTVSAQDSPKGSDLTGQLSIQSFDFYYWRYELINGVREKKEYILVKDNVVQDTKIDGKAPKLSVGDNIKLSYKWNIPSVEPKGGDFIRIPLPEIFEFSQMLGGVLPLKKPDTQTQVGEYQVVQDQDSKKWFIEAKFYKVVEDHTMKNGNFDLGGTLSQDGDSVNISIAPLAPINFKISPKSGPGWGENRWGTFDKKDRNIYKEGKSNGATGAIEWTIYANFVGLKQYVLSDTTTLPEEYKLNDVVIVDRLPEDIEYVKVQPYVALYAPNKNGELSWSSVLHIAPPFKEMKSGLDKETLDEFINRIKATNEFTFGIYQDIKSQVVVVYLGDLGTEKAKTYNQLYELHRKKEINLVQLFKDFKYEGNTVLDEKQINKLIAMYDKKPVVSWYINLQGKVLDRDSATRQYDNTAELRASNPGHDYKPAVYSLKHAWIQGGVDLENMPVNIKVTKQWKDNTAPADAVVKVQLVENDVPVDKFILLNESVSWTNSFKGLPRKIRGVPVKYGVKEVPFDGFTSEVTGNVTDGFVITNTKIPTTKIKVTKLWEGGEPADGTKVLVKVMNGAVEAGTIEIVKVGDAWVAEKEFPKNDDGGNAIAYTIQEEKVDGYTANPVEGTLEDGFTITNKKDATVVPTVKFNITKSWVGAAEDEYKNLEVKVNVYAEGNVVAVNAEPIVLNLANQWKAEIVLPKADAVTNLDYVYSVKEVPVTGFKSEVTGDTANGFVVTNTKEEELPNPSVPVTTPSAETTAAVTTTQKDTAPDYFPPATTTTATANIDEDEAARGGVTTTTTATANINDDEVARGGVTTTTSNSNLGGAGDKLPHTGNLPNELFYLIGAFVATLGVLVLALDKLKK